MATGTAAAVKLLIAAALVVGVTAPLSGSADTSSATPIPTFGNPTISGVQGYGFEQDLRLDSHGRVYTSAPGGLGGNVSYLWRSLNGGQSFKWVPAAAQPVGKLPMCNGGGDTELATDSADTLYVNDLALANYGTARSTDQGQTMLATPCTGVLTAPDDRPWYAVDGNPAQGGSITLAYNVAPNATPLPNPHKCTDNILAFARSPVGLPASAGLVFGPAQFMNAPCDGLEGIMGNDEVFTYGSVKRVFAMHNNDALNQVRMARCDIVPFSVSSPTGYANCVDRPIFSDATTVNGGDFPTLAIDRAGNLIAIWEQARCSVCPNTIISDTLPYYSVSTNQGEAWSAPRQVPTPGLHTNVFAWPAAGDPGRVDVAWYGTATSAPFPGSGPCSVTGDWGLYMVQSLNFTSGSPTWTQPILASEHFIHRGSVQTLMGGQTGDRVLGDFLQLRIGLQGEANISYADSNSDTEALLVAQAMFVRQNGGSSLFARRPVVRGAAARVNSVTVGSHPATFDSAGLSSTSQPNLEILGSHMSMPNPSTYEVKVLVADLTSLSPKADAGGTTLVWNTQWKAPSATDPHGGAFFHAYMESVAGGAPTFWVGQNAVVPTTGTLTLTYPGATQVTGSYTATAPGVITIDVPTADVAEAAPINNLLYSVTTASMTLTGNAENPPNFMGTGEGGNPFNLVDVAPAYDFNPAQPTPPFTTCHEGDGAGELDGERGGSASFSFDGDSCEDGTSESVSEQDSSAGTDFHSTSISAITFDDLAHTVTILGDGVNSGLPVTFTMIGVDNGVLPGAFSLTLSDGYSVSGLLTNGTIQLQP